MVAAPVAVISTGHHHHHQPQFVSSHWKGGKLKRKFRYFNGYKWTTTSSSSAIKRRGYRI
jgi:hypothetical protein